MTMSFRSLVPGKTLTTATLALLALTGPAMAASGALSATADPSCDKHLPTQTVAVEEMEQNLQDLFRTFQDLPSFIDVYFYPNDPVQYRPMFVESVPAAAQARPTRVPVAFDVVSDMPQPAGNGPTPDQGDIQCNGIRPGVRLSVPAGSCTANWVFTDGTDTYLGTAGHCIATGQLAVVVGVGPVGKAVFSVNGGIGNDFALIKLNTNVLGLVTAEMCDWAGPTGTFAGSGIQAHAMLHAGHGGVAIGDLPSQPKVGVGGGYGTNSFSWWGEAIPGDSGSAIRVEGGGAVGIITHLGVGITGIDFGTRLGRAISLATPTVPNLQLVTVGWVHPI